MAEAHRFGVAEPHKHCPRVARVARIGALFATITPIYVLFGIDPSSYNTETLSPFMWGLSTLGVGLGLLVLEDLAVGSWLRSRVDRRRWRYLACITCLLTAGLLVRLIDQAGSPRPWATHRTTVISASNGKYPSLLLAPFGRSPEARKVLQRDTEFGSARAGTPVLVTETPGILGIGQRRYFRSH